MTWEALKQWRSSCTWVGATYRAEAKVESTNDVLARWVEEGAPHGAVVCADQQTRGRGQKGRFWFSPEGQNLYVSMLLRPPWSATELPPISLLIAVAVSEALMAFELENVTVKWPNDVLVDGQKVAGILCELSTRALKIDHIVVGIGVNVNQREFPSALEKRATSLALQLGRNIPRVALLDRLAAEIEEVLTPVLADARDTHQALTLWRERAPWIGGPVRVQQGERIVEGTATSLAPDGALLIVDDQGEQHRVVSGELI